MTKGAKAQLFTLDLLLALVPLTIALGISANAMSGVSTQVQDYTDWYSYNRLINDAADTLIKTAGEPPDWNSTNTPNTLGLANYSNTSGVGPYYLDDRKIGALNTTVAGGPLYQVGISRLLGNETFPYFNLSFIGATVNTTDLFISFSNGSRSDALNIYAVERTALLEIEKRVGIMEEVGHFESNSTPCCGNPGNGQREYNTSFFIANGDIAMYDYWVYGEWISGTVTNKYDIDPNAGVGCNCAVPNPNEDIDTLNSISPSFVEQIDKTNELTENSDNEFIVRPEGSGYANYYVIRAPIGTASGLISPDITGPTPVTVILEVGR